MRCETRSTRTDQQLHAKFQNQLRWWRRSLSICIEKMHSRGDGEWARAHTFPMQRVVPLFVGRLHAKKRRLATTLTIHAHFLHNCSGRVRTTCCASRSQVASAPFFTLPFRRFGTKTHVALCHLAFVWTLKLILNTRVLFAQHALGL
jgi:hypothetical protein